MEAPQNVLRRLVGVATAAVLLGTAAHAAQTSTPDTVFRVDPRGDGVRTVSGVVETNSLEEVVVQRESSTDLRLDSTEVVSIVWGQVPPSFSDARKFAQRGDHENAVAKFRVAAGDASARPVVQAAARLRAAEELLAWGASDPTRLPEAVSEVDTFLADHPANRSVPEARRIKARAHWLAGDAAAAGAEYKAIYEAGRDGSTPGYGVGDSLEAGLHGAFALLEAGDSLQARELFNGVGTGYGSALAGATDDVARVRYETGQEIAGLGDLFVELAGGNADAAATGFAGRIDSMQTAGGQGAARLGLAEARLAQGDAREAQIEFAKVTALDHSSRDRIARALVGLAEATRSVGDTDAANTARRTLTRVVETYGDTPAARRAKELLEG